MGYRAIL